MAKSYAHYTSHHLGQARDRLAAKIAYHKETLAMLPSVPTTPQGKRAQTLASKGLRAAEHDLKTLLAQAHEYQCGCIYPAGKEPGRYFHHNCTKCMEP
jgi:hypothetical protein